MMTHYDIAYWLGLGIAAPFWLSVPKAGPQEDDIYLNRDGQIRAGVDVTDYVLGAGDAVAGRP